MTRMTPITSLVCSTPILPTTYFQCCLKIGDGVERKSHWGHIWSLQKSTRVHTNFRWEPDLILAQINWSSSSSFSEGPEGGRSSWHKDTPAPSLPTGKERKGDLTTNQAKAPAKGSRSIRYILLTGTSIPKRCFLSEISARLSNTQKLRDLQQMQEAECNKQQQGFT